jgi:hypothetical protein
MCGNYRLKAVAKLTGVGASAPVTATFSIKR